MNPKKLLRKSYVTFIIIIFWGLWSFPQICTGLEIFRPTSITDLASKTSDTADAYDDNLSTSADIETNVDAFPSIIFHNFQPTATEEYISLRLTVNRSSNGHEDDKWGIKYSTDGGSSWLSLESMSSQNIVVQNDISVELDTSQDLNLLQVRIDTDRKKKADGGQVHIYEIWVEGEIAPTPSLRQSAYRFFEVNDSNEFYEQVSDIPGTDEANAIAIDSAAVPPASRSMYVVGLELGKWRIEKRLLSDGSSVGTFDDDGVVISDPSGSIDEANAIAIDTAPADPADHTMYVVGSDRSLGASDAQWRIEKRACSNGNLLYAIVANFSVDDDIPYAIAIDGTSMYVVGSDRSLGASDAQWRIEKRACSDGTLEDARVVNFSVDDDIPYAIAINSAPVAPDVPSMYVVGYDRIPGSSSRRGRGNNRVSSNAEWRIEKRSLFDLSVLGSVNSDPTNNFDIARGIAIDNNHMYVIGSEGLGFFDTAWRIEKRLLFNLSVETSFGTNGIITADYGYDDQPTAIAIDTDPADPADHTMYVAGFSNDLGSGGDTAWHIEKRDLVNGNLVAIVVNDIDSKYNDKANAIAIDTAPADPADHTMYVAGYSTNSRFSDDLPVCTDPPTGCLPDDLPDWRIVKRDLSDLSLDVLEHAELVLSEGILLPIAAQDLPVSRNNGQEFRLKMLLHVDDVPLPLNFYQFKLQYSNNSGDDYYDITDETPDFSDQSPIVFKDNPIASDGTTIIGSGGGFDPLHSGHSPISFQTYEEANNFTNSVSEILVGKDGMWDFSLYVTNNADPGEYIFRIVIDNGMPDDGIPLNNGYISPEPAVTVP
ncbi:MAG: hypothetical protein ACYSTS_17205 [Planctomycetota bacterium]|jgi:hypothetical protein